MNSCSHRVTILKTVMCTFAVFAAAVGIGGLVATARGDEYLVPDDYPTIFAGMLAAAANGSFDGDCQQSKAVPTGS